jgi:hypothetical protein
MRNRLSFIPAPPAVKRWRKPVCNARSARRSARTMNKNRNTQFLCYEKKKYLIKSDGWVGEVGLQPTFRKKEWTISTRKIGSAKRACVSLSSTATTVSPILIIYVITWHHPAADNSYEQCWTAETPARNLPRRRATSTRPVPITFAQFGFKTVKFLNCKVPARSRPALVALDGN